jgi:excisionase family DNA binding protein
MEPSTVPTPGFVSVRQVCALCGVSRSTVYRMLGAGTLRARKNGARTLIEVASINEVLAALPVAEFRPSPARPSASAA